MTKYILDILNCPVSEVFQCGSRITCNPPVVDTDEDWMILINEDEMLNLNSRLVGLGFELGGSVCVNETTTAGPELFWSYTKDSLNLLITCCPEFFGKFKLATKVATRLNLLKKEDRITLFQAILYGN